MSRDRWADDRSRWREHNRTRDRDDGVDTTVRERPFPHLDALDDRRALVTHRGEFYQLRRDDVEVLRAVGTFRAVYSADLREDHPHLDGNVRALREQGLLASATMLAPDRTEREVLTLTAAGRDLIQAAEPGDQEYFAGFVKPRELHHDASLYAIYRQHIRAPQARGAEVDRIRLDHALKRELWTRDHAQLSPADRADKIGLPYDPDQGIQVPDLQIVLRDPDGTISRVNVDFVTPHYPAAAIRAKQAAGFHLYIEDTPAHGRADDRDLAARFLLL